MVKKNIRWCVKDYIRHQLKRFGGLFLFHCNYNVKDHPIPSQFYAEMFQWWAEFRDGFSAEKYWQSIIWNNKDVRINNAPVFYKTFLESGIICVNDLLFDLININSYNIIYKNVAGEVNCLTWAGLRHAIPSHHRPECYCLSRHVLAVLSFPMRGIILHRFNFRISDCSRQ